MKNDTALLNGIIAALAIGIVVVSNMDARETNKVRHELDWARAQLQECQCDAVTCTRANHERDWAAAQLSESHRDLEYCHNHAIGWQAE